MQLLCSLLSCGNKNLSDSSAASESNKKRSREKTQQWQLYKVKHIFKTSIRFDVKSKFNLWSVRRNNHSDCNWWITAVYKVYTDISASVSQLNNSLNWVICWRSLVIERLLNEQKAQILKSGTKKCLCVLLLCCVFVKCLSSVWLTTQFKQDQYRSSLSSFTSRQRFYVIRSHEGTWRGRGFSSVRPQYGGLKVPKAKINTGLKITQLNVCLYLFYIIILYLLLHWIYRSGLYD